MCIILGKLKGQDDFTLEQINNAMSNNSDGSSITIIDNGKLLAMFKSVEQDKFLSYRSSIMEQYKDKWKDFDVIYHFRIATMVVFVMIIATHLKINIISYGTME